MFGSRSACVAVLLALLVFAGAAAQKSGANEKNNKLHQMRQMALGSSNYIVEMDAKMYR